MAKLFSTIILFTAVLMNCNTGYTEERTINYDPLCDLNREFLDKCDIVTDTNDIINFGKVYFQGEKKKQYLVDEDGKFFFDLKTVSEKRNQKQIKDLFNNGGWNLIVKKCDNDTSNTCTVMKNVNIPSNTNLIIPYGINLTKNNQRITFTNNSSVYTSTILVLGNLLSNFQNNPFGGEAYSLMDIFNTGNKAVNIIIGPNATYTKNTNKVPIYPYSGSVNFLLYPQCVLSTNSNQNSIFTGRNDIIPTNTNETKLILNRFISKSSGNEKLSGRAERRVNIVYPGNIGQNDLSTGVDQWHNDTCTTTKYFENFYWVGTQHKSGINTGQEGTYSFEYPEIPLTFTTNEDGKEVLEIDKTKEFAKYDAKLWNECSINGEYGFNKYNVSENKNKYMDVDKTYKLFYGIKEDETALEINTDIIHLGLIGDRDIQLNTSSDNIKLLGDNSEYCGSIIVPDNVKKVYFGNENSCVDISSNNKLENEIIQEVNK